VQQIFIILGLVAFFAGFIWMWRRSIQRVEDTQPPPAPRPIEETPEYKKVQAGGFRAWTFEQTLEPLSSEQQPGDEANSAWANDPLLNELRRLDQVEGKPSGYDISPDGAELLVLHGDDCATLFDIASGKAVKSWTNITPPEWRGAGGEVTALSCAGRRMIICVGEYPGEVVSIELEAGEARLLEDIGDEYGEATVITAMISGDGRYAVHFMVYSKGHSVFDLELQSSWGFGDFILVADGSEPRAAISSDGSVFVVEGIYGLALARLGRPPSPSTESPEHWPSYGEENESLCEDVSDAMRFSPDNNHLVIVGDEGKITICELKSGETVVHTALMEIAAKDAAAKQAAAGDENSEALADIFFENVVFMPDGEHIVAQSYRPYSELFKINLSTGAIAGRYRLPDAIGCSLSPNGAFALLSSGKADFRILPLGPFPE
jgi:hypothetical protein